MTDEEIYGSFAGGGKSSPESRERLLLRVLSEANLDEPITTNERGGSQSLIEYRFDLVDPLAALDEAHILYVGAIKYGEENWRLIPIREHMNHAKTHMTKWMAGDRSQNHLGHALCRIRFARALELAGE